MTAWAIGETSRFRAALVYPREGHGLVERNHQLDLLRRTRAWFDRWLAGPAPDQDPAGRASAGLTS